MTLALLCKHLGSTWTAKAVYALYGTLKPVHMARPRPTSRTHKKAFVESTLAAQKATLIIKSWLEESCREGSFDTTDLKGSISKAVFDVGEVCALQLP